MELIDRRKGDTVSFELHWLVLHLFSTTYEALLSFQGRAVGDQPNVSLRCLFYNLTLAVQALIVLAHVRTRFRRTCSAIRHHVLFTIASRPITGDTPQQLYFRSLPLKLASSTTLVGITSCVSRPAYKGQSIHCGSSTEANLEDDPADTAEPQQLADRGVGDRLAQSPY